MGEEEWNQDQRRLLLELGLAVEWTNEYPSDEEEGRGRWRDRRRSPSADGLKIIKCRPLQHDTYHQTFRHP